jgi:hypothetical protein
LHLDGPVVGVRDAPDDRQPQPGPGHAPGGGRPVEALEDAREIFIGDARAVIRHRHLAVLDQHPDPGASRGPLDGVVDQVADGVIDCGRVHLHQARMQLGLDDRERGALPQAAHRLIGQ